MYVEISILIATFCVCLLGLLGNLKRSKAFENVPGPTGLPYVGNAFDLLDGGAFHKKIYNWQQEFGHIFAFKTGPVKFLGISDPQIVHQILVENRRNFTNSEVFRIVFGWFFPKSVIVLENESWKRVRRIAVNAIGGANLRKFVPIVEQCTEKLVEKCMKELEERGEVIDGEKGVTVDLHNSMRFLLFDSFGEFGFGTHFHMQENENIALFDASLEIVRAINDRCQLPVKWMWYLPTRRNWKIYRAYKILMDMATKLTEEREREIREGKVVRDQVDATGKKVEYDNLLTSMILSKGSELSQQEIVDNITSFFFGSYETTGNTLSFTFAFLANFPHCQEKLFDEINNLGAEGVTYDSISNNCPYLSNVIRESMRLLPTSIAIPRTCESDAIKLRVCGEEEREIEVPKGTVCIFNVLSMGRDGNFWYSPGEREREKERDGEKPKQTNGEIEFIEDDCVLKNDISKPDILTFRPERYEEETDEEEKFRRFVSFPFGAGSRMCIGQKVALIEMKTIIAIMVKRFRILPVENVELCTKMTMTVKNGAKFRLVPRG